MLSVRDSLIDWLLLCRLLAQVNETQSFYTMFDTRHAELGSWFRDHTPIDARVAISTHGGHWRPEMSLAGRAVMTSYAGCVLACVSPLAP